MPLATILFAHLPETAGVYRIVNTITGDSYVGASVNVRRRCSQHDYQLAANEHYAKEFQKSYNDHGYKAFTCELIDECDLVELNARELAWIERLKPAFNNGSCTGAFRDVRKMAAAIGPLRKRIYKQRKPKSTLNGRRLTHEQRRARRQEIADAIRGGESLHDVALRYRVTPSTVGLACQEFKVSRFVIRTLTKKKKLEDLRARIVSLVQAGKTSKEIAKELGTLTSTIDRTCCILKIKRQRGHRRGVPASPNITFVPREVWEVVDWSKTDAAISRELLISTQRVWQVRKRLGKLKPKQAQNADQTPAE
jgi:group I intron endonuclease